MIDRAMKRPSRAEIAVLIPCTKRPVALFQKAQLVDQGIVKSARMPGARIRRKDIDYVPRMRFRRGPGAGERRNVNPVSPEASAICCICSFNSPAFSLLTETTPAR